jgi:3-hydroxybutyryl-CoA dehydrogenase
MKEIIGVIGAGTMGAGIAQVAAQAGHKVVLSDTNPEQLLRAEQQIKKSIDKLIEKGKFPAQLGQEILHNLQFSTQILNIKKKQKCSNL